MEPRGRERHRWAKPRGRNARERMSQCGQRASFNRDRDLADEPHWCSLVFGCRNACGVIDTSTPWKSTTSSGGRRGDLYGGSHRDFESD
jgi:hypothetical protein